MGSLLQKSSLQGKTKNTYSKEYNNLENGLGQIDPSLRFRELICNLWDEKRKQI